MTLCRCLRNRINRVPSFLVLFLCGFHPASNAYAQALTNANFETPVLSGLIQYSPATDAEQPWSFTGYCGIAKDGGNPNSSFAVADTNYPGQYAFLQLWQTSGSAISRPVLFPASGTFRFAYQEAGRQLAPSGAGGDLRYEVCISNTVSGAAVLCITNQASTDQVFLSRTHSFDIDSPGLYELTFRAIEHTGIYSDNAALIDSVSISRIDGCFSRIEIGQDVWLTWSSGSNDLFRVQKKATLQDANWVDAGSDIQSTGSVTSVSVPRDPQSQTGFYRVQRISP